MTNGTLVPLLSGDTDPFLGQYRLCMLSILSGGLNAMTRCADNLKVVYIICSIVYKADDMIHVPCGRQGPPAHRTNVILPKRNLHACLL
jgi:hypothetical protein